MKKVLIDSSSLISLSLNCLLKILSLLKQSTGVQFLITEVIKDEVIDNALKVDRFKLSGIRLSKLLRQGVIQLTDLDYAKAARLLKLANSIYVVQGKPVKVVHKGEMQAVVAALSQECSCMIVDERIISALVEDPYDLRLILESRLHKKVEINKPALSRLKSELGDFGVIKSSDLVGIAYEKRLLKELSLDKNDFQFLKAALWGLKYSGCALSTKDLSEYYKYLKPE